MDLQILKNELLNDPEGLGYSGKTAQQKADLLNGLTQTMERIIIPTWEILEATVQSEWSALTAAEKQRYQTFVSVGSLNVKGTNVRAAFAAMFGAGTQTRANLLALQNEVVSRAQVLGLGFITSQNVIDAEAA